MPDDRTTAETPVAELFEYKNPKTHRTLTLPKVLKTDRGDVDLQVLFQDTIEKSKMDAKAKVQEQLAELEIKVKDFDAVSARLNELETSGLTAQQKAQREAEHIASNLKRAQEDAERYKSKLYTERVSNAIYSEFGEVKGLNINKATTLFKAECNPRIVDKNGELLVMADYDGQELPLSEVRAKWIARDDNKFLLQNTLSSGAGSSGSSSSIDAKQMKRADFDALDASKRMAFMKDGGKVND